jgi:hypothetical protein
MSYVFGVNYDQALAASVENNFVGKLRISLSSLVAGMAPSERGQSCPLSTRLLRDGLLRFAGGVPAPTRLLAVGACGRTVLLPLHVNGRLLTGTRATAASGLRIFFRSCHINLHETLVSMTGLSRSMPLRGSLILWDQSGFRSRIRGIRKPVGAQWKLRRALTRTDQRHRDAAGGAHIDRRCP